MSATEEIAEVVEEPVVLSDGTAATIRRLTAADLPAVRLLHERLPAQDVYRRFFGFSRHAAREASRLVVGDDSVAVELFRDGLLEGVVNFRGSEPPDMALAVDHAAQHSGIGTLLLEALIALARKRGIRTLEADVLATNSAMIEVLAESGLSIAWQYDGPVTHVRISVPEHIEGPYAMALKRRQPAAPVSPARGAGSSGNAAGTARLGLGQLAESRSEAPDQPEEDRHVE